MSQDGNLLELDDLKVWFPIKSGLVLDRHVGDIRAVDGVSLKIRSGETLGLVGESGCGCTSRPTVGSSSTGRTSPRSARGSCALCAGAFRSVSRTRIRR